MKLTIVLLAVVAAVSAHPVYDPWAAPVLAHPQVIPWPAPQPTYVKQYAPVLHSQAYAAPIYGHGHGVAVHQQVYKVAQQPPIPALHPQPLNIKVPHTQSVRLPTGPIHYAQPHLIGVQYAAPEPAPIIAKAVVHKTIHPVAVAEPVWPAPVHPW